MSALDEPLHNVRVVARPGSGEVYLDDVEVSGHVLGVEIRAFAREIPQVVIHQATHPGSEHVFEGLATVVVASTDPGPAAATFLAGIDPEILMQAAINRPDLGHDAAALTRAMLDQLIDWASGRA